MSRDRFLIEVADLAGVIKERERSTFYEALSTVKWFRTLYPHCAILVTNLEKADYGTDGLTDEQREQISEAVR